MDFDPDAYLSQKLGSQPAPSAAPAFDPDAYLAQKMGGKPAAPTPDQEHEANVAKYSEEAKQFQNEVPLESALPSIQIPIISDIARKGAAFVSSLPSDNKMGETQGERYKNILARQDAIERERQARQSKLASGIETAGNVAGSIALSPALGIEAAATKVLPGVAGRVLGAAGEGAAYGTASHITSAPAEKTIGQTISEIPGAAGEGALFGAAAVPIAGVVSGAAGKTKNLYNFLFNPEEYAIQKAAQAASKAAPNAPGLSAAEAEVMSNKGAPVNISDIRGVKPELERAATIAPDSQHLADLNQSLSQRLQESSQKFQNILDDSYSSLVGVPKSKIDPIAVKNAAYEEARKVNGPAYNAAYNAPTAQNIWTPELQNFVNTEAGQKAIKFAVENSKLASFAKGSRPLQNPFVKDDNGIFVLKPNSPPPNLEFWDQAKRGLNDQVSSLYRSGDNGAAKIASDAQAALTQHLKDIVPKYETALAGAKRYIDQDNAFDAGMDFFRLADTSTKTDPIKLRKQIEIFRTPTAEGGYTPKEREMFNQGLVSYIKDNPVQAAKIFSKGDAVTMNNISSVMHPELFNAAKTAAQATRISAMNNEIKELKSKGFLKGAVGLGAGVAGATLVENFPEVMKFLAESPSKAIGLGLLAGAGAAGRSALNRARIAQANRLLKMATSQDPAVIMKLNDYVAKNADARNVLDKIEVGLSHYLAANYDRQNRHADGGRVGRKSGGRVGASSKADKLILGAEKAKKNINKHTEVLLNQPDSTIVHALSIAKKAI